MVFLSRILQGIATLWLSATVAFFLVHASGDPAVQILGDSATPEALDAVRANLGLDRPLPVQYVESVGRWVRGDFGDSLRFGQSNLSMIGDRIGATALLTGTALFLAALIGIPLGMLAALHAGRLIDRVTSGIAVLGQSIPVYWLGLVMVLVFAVRLGWFPVGQFTSLWSLVLPAMALATLPLAQIARITRASMMTSLNAPYVVASRARGLSPRSVLVNHALRNSSLAIVTVVGLQAGLLLAGAVTVEAVFAWPGVGTLAIQAVQARDLPLVETLVICGASAFVVINSGVDLLCAWIDPRIRRS